MNSRSKAGCPGASGIEDQVFVAILRAADAMFNQAEQLMKASGLTAGQYNVLRILRGAGPEGLPCNQISERMISRDPDMTRMLDRIEARKLITRERQTEDRRVVKARITGEGLKLLKKLDAPVRELHKRQFSGLSAAKQKALLELLTELISVETEQLSPASRGQFSEGKTKENKI
jgi:DNA-binding MarR family transcriptional regulator